MATLAQTDEPFGEALTRLKDDSGWSFREIARRAQLADPAGKGFSASHVSHLAGGERPSPMAIVLLAKVFGVAPEYFREYRLAQVRALFDEAGPGGAEKALALYEELDGRIKRIASTVDVAEYPQSLPAGAGPAMRRRAR